MTLAMAITEPGCGSDSSRVQTTAVLDGDEWVLNGEKIFVTTGCRAEGVVVWATIDKAAGRAGIKSFLVEKGTPGFEVAHKEKKLGIRADDTAAYVFQDCRIPRDNLLGGDESVAEGRARGGFKGVMKTFNMTRPRGRGDRPRHGRGGARLHPRGAREGGRRDRLERRPRTRSRRGRSSCCRDRGRHRGRDARRCCTRPGSRTRRKPNNLEASIAKAKARRAVREITQGCIEILGPMGVSREHLLEKWFRDVPHHRHLRGHRRRSSA